MAEQATEWWEMPTQAEKNYCLTDPKLEAKEVLTKFLGDD